MNYTLSDFDDIYAYIDDVITESNHEEQMTTSVNFKTSGRQGMETQFGEMQFYQRSILDLPWTLTAYRLIEKQHTP